MSELWRNDGTHLPDPPVTTPIEVRFPCDCIPPGASVDWPDVTSMLSSLLRRPGCDSAGCPWNKR